MIRAARGDAQASRARRTPALARRLNCNGLPHGGGTWMQRGPSRAHGGQRRPIERGRPALDRTLRLWGPWMHATLRTCAALLSLLLVAGAAGASPPEKDELKLGFIKLTDCAPLVIAKEQGKAVGNIGVSIHAELDRSKQKRADVTVLNEVRMTFTIGGTDSATAAQLESSLREFFERLASVALTGRGREIDSETAEHLRRLASDAFWPSREDAA